MRMNPLAWYELNDGYPESDWQKTVGQALA